jgi:hypothetical protein
MVSIAGGTATADSSDPSLIVSFSIYAATWLMNCVTAARPAICSPTGRPGFNGRVALLDLLGIHKALAHKTFEARYQLISGLLGKTLIEVPPARPVRQ